MIGTRARWVLGVLALVGVGLALAGVGKVALDHTNSTAFCISCHEMKDNNFAEYRTTIHARNRTGVVTACADCHVPHEFPDVLWRKVGAANDVIQHLRGRIETKAQFETHRLELARKVWARMKSTDSRECRHCHDPAAMVAELQGRTAQKQHRRIASEGKTCIDCHAGIAHKEPGGGEPADAVAGAVVDVPTGAVAVAVTGAAAR